MKRSYTAAIYSVEGQGVDDDWLCSLAHDVFAADHPVINSTEIAPGVFFTLHAPDETVAEREDAAAILERRCGGNYLQCGANHVPSVTSCNELIRYLESISGRVLPWDPRDAWLSQSGSICCVSWSAGVSGITVASLLPAARRTNRECVTVSRRSGLIRDTRILGVCLTLCLSNRHNGCS